MKAKNTLKKLGCALAVAACVTGTTAPMVHATTTDFTFTVSSKQSLNTDTMSKRTMKADNEQRYYAKATSFSAAGTIYVHSRKIVVLLLACVILSIAIIWKITRVDFELTKEN